MKPVAFDLQRPSDLVSAIRDLKDLAVDTKVIAGGQSLGPMLNLRLTRPERLVEVSNTGLMRDISDTAAHVSFGAATRHAEIEDGLTPDPTRGMMPFVAHGIAYRAVRNKGTIGGSICHADPAADWVTAMTALDATIVITTNGNDMRTVPMSSFMQGAYRTSLAAGEIMTAVQVPKYSDQMVWGYYKVCRKVGEFADAIAAWVADPAKKYSRVVFGAGAGAPLGSDRLATLLAQTGAVPDLATIKEELAALEPGLDPVKQHLFAVALQRCVKEALSDE
jgi:carbon-monoxide dehydrogenase medium subunit